METKRLYAIVGVPLLAFNLSAGASEDDTGSPMNVAGGPLSAEQPLIQIETRQMRTGSTVSGYYGHMVTGDFNDDGYEDVAVGQYQTVGSNTFAGAVSIHYGSVAGVLSNNHVWHQDSPGIAGKAEQDDFFGRRLAVGDLNGDGFDDLAIGVPREDVNGDDSGAVHILYGGFNGISGFGSRILTGTEGWRLGTVLETGNFNDDVNPTTGLPIDDLAIGMPFANLGLNGPLSPDLEGIVYIYHGSPNGIGSVRTRSISQEGSIVGDPEDGDKFGYSLAAGDYNGDGRDDLAIGIPGEDLDTDWTPWENDDDAGAVIVVMGSPDGLTNDGNYSIDRRDDGAPGDTGEGDQFGWSLMAGDFNGDGKSDLAIASKDDVNGDRFGSVNVHYGNGQTLRFSSPERWYTARSDMPGPPPTTGSRFGRYLNVGNFNNDINPATGLPLDDLVVTGDLHVHHILPGQPDGIDPTRFLVWTNDSDSPLNDYNPYNSLFFVVSAGDFNGDGQSDLVGLDFLLPEEFRVETGMPGEMPVSGDVYGRLSVLEMSEPGRLGYGNIYRRTVYGPGGSEGPVFSD